MSVDFTNRFVAGTGYTNDDVQTMTESQMLANFPELKIMERMVRNHSVLLRSVSNLPLLRIFNTITQHSDPRIALYMAGAKQRDNTHYFQGLDQIRNLMFGDPDNNPTPNQDLFRDGIRRVSAALAAAVLIGEFSQLEQQYAHAKLLEEQAIQDLRAIVETYPVKVAAPPKQEVSQEAAFFFEPGKADSNFTVQFYVPSTPHLGWQTVANYTSPTLISTVISDLADAINEFCLNTSNSNILCAVVLSDGTTLHKLTFQPRLILPELYSEIISVRIFSNHNPTMSPFKWGVRNTVLKNEPLNSLIIAIKNARFTSASTEERVTDLPVIYFRRIENVTVNTDFLIKYRVLAHTELTTDVLIPYLTDSNPSIQAELDSYRHAQTAEALAESLAIHREDTKVVAAIIRNDPLTVSRPVCGLLPVAFSYVNPFISYVLDILEVPPDIEIALGTLTGPVTSFSRRQRSVKINVADIINESSVDKSGLKDRPKLSKVSNLNIRQVIREEESNIDYLGLV